MIDEMCNVKGVALSTKPNLLAHILIFWPASLPSSKTTLEANW